MAFITAVISPVKPAGCIFSAALYSGFVSGLRYQVVKPLFGAVGVVQVTVKLRVILYIIQAVGIKLSVDGCRTIGLVKPGNPVGKQLYLQVVHFPHGKVGVGSAIGEEAQHSRKKRINQPFTG